jgi:hypothetical protein
VGMEGMYLPLAMVEMRPLVGMELGRRGMIIGDKRQAVRPPSSGGRLSAKEVVGRARRQFHHFIEIPSCINSQQSRRRNSLADRSKQREYWIQQQWTHIRNHAGCIPLIIRLHYNHLTSSTRRLPITFHHTSSQSGQDHLHLLLSPVLPFTPSHSHNRPRNKSPSPSLGHPHQITLSLPYPYPFHLHPFSELEIIGENGGKRANRTSLEISVSRVYVSAFVFYCVIHPLLTTCRAHEEGGGGRKKDPPPSSSKLFKNSHKPLLTTLFLPKCNPGPLPTFPSSPHGRVCRSRCCRWYW